MLTDDKVISDLELDNILCSLRPLGLESVGSREWVQQMSMLEELNIQAALQARRQEEETVRDALVQAEKLPHVLTELLVVELWREELLPRILDIGEPASSFQVKKLKKMFSIIHFFHYYLFDFRAT